MKEILHAIKENNINYVANNLRFVEFTCEEYVLALNISPTTEMTLCLVKGIKLKEEVPYHKLTKACLKANFSELTHLLDQHKFSISILGLLLECSSNPIVKKMLNLSISKLSQSE